MARFFYKAKVAPCQVIEGVVEAESKEQALIKLNKKGYFLLSLEEEKEILKKERGGLRGKVSVKEISLFTYQLASLLSSGVMLSHALKITIEQLQNRYFCSVVRDICYRVESGSSFSESLSMYPHIFSSFYVAMVKAGEASGNLEESLQHLKENFEKESQLRAQIIELISYPVFIIGVGIVTLIILLGFVIPKLSAMFEEMMYNLPFSTKLLISFSHFIKNWWGVFFLLFAIFLFVIIRFFFRQNKFAIDKFKLHIPFLGELIKKIEMGYFFRTLSMLLSGGLALMESLGISASVVRNVVIRKEIERFKKDIEKGLSFSFALRNSSYFSLFVKSIINVGEETGKLEKSLLFLSQVFFSEVEGSLRRFMKILEPTIILIIGIFVGFIVISMLLPIFQLNFVVK